VNRLFLLGLSLCMVGLLGCRAEQDPIASFIAQSRLEAKVKVAELQKEAQFEAQKYQPLAAREPFTLPQNAVVAPKLAQDKSCWQPRNRKKREALEHYPLAKLRLRGVMSREGQVSGLIQHPAGGISKVVAGNYLGRNRGKVLKITSRYVLIEETLPDGMGCWQHRRVKLAMK